jgi:hypothetical protein
MVEFRQKNFGKPLRKAVEKGKKVWDENKATIGVIGTGISAVNLGINLSRGKNEKKFQQEQVEATNRLTDAINSTSDENRKTLKRKKRTIKVSQKPYVRDKSLPEPIEKAKEKSLETIKIKRKS